MADGDIAVKETDGKRIGEGLAGPGRPKGSQNKTTALLKDAVLEAAAKAGGKAGLIGYLKTQAQENPTAFMTLLGRAMPLQVNHADSEGGKLQPAIFVGIEPAPAPQAGARALNGSH